MIDQLWIPILIVFGISTHQRLIPEAISLETQRVSENIAVGSVLVDYRSILNDRKLLRNDLSPVFTLIRSPEFFDFNHETSRLLVAKPIDRELICGGAPNFDSQCLHQVELMVELKRAVVVVKQTFEIVDLNDNLPVFARTQLDLSLSENTELGTKFEIPCPSDPDSKTNGIQNIRIVEASSDHFELYSPNRACPQIKLAKVLDYETAKTHNFEVCAFERDQSRFGCLSVRINVTDENDNGPVFVLGPNDHYSFNLSENTLVGSIIGKVSAVDQDGTRQNSRISYSIDPQIDLGIHPDSGHLRLLRKLDYERFPRLELVVSARDHGKPVRRQTARLVISVLNVNDNEPTMELMIGSGRSLHHAPSNKCVELTENASVGTQIALIRLQDRDDPDGTNLYLQNLSSSLPFEIVRLSSSAVYSVRLSGPIDRETKDFYNLRFQARDSLGLSKEKTLTVERSLCLRVLDVNDNIPVFSRSLYEFEIFENNRPNSVVGHLAVSDQDQGPNGAVSISILNHNDLFAIRGTTLYVLTSLDREQCSEYDIEVEARDHGQPNQLWSRSMVKLRVLDQNDNSPRFNRTSYVIAVEENKMYEGTKIKSFKAYDADGHPFNGVEYYVGSSSGQETFAHYFTLDKLTGDLRMKRSIDREMVDKINFVLVASDRHNRTLTTNASVTITVIDVNDNSPVILMPENDSIVCATSEQLIQQSPVKFLVHDNDRGPNAQVELSQLKVKRLLDKDNLFPDPSPMFYSHNNGELRVREPIAGGAFKIEAKFSDHGRPSRSTNVQFVLMISDITNNCSRLKLSYLKTLRSTTNTANETITKSLFALCVICALLVVIIYLSLMAEKRKMCWSKFKLNSSNDDDLSITTKSKHVSSTSELECNGFSSNSFDDSTSCSLIRHGTNKISTVV